MICRKFKKYIIDSITDTISIQNKSVLMGHIKVCKKCRRELQELETSGKAVTEYFKHTKIPYNNAIEEKITARLFSNKISILSIIKQLNFKFQPILRPAMVFILAFFLVLIGIHEYKSFQENKVIREISGIIDINQFTMDFILLNNVDYIAQLYIESASDIALIDKDEFYSDINYSLYIYLMGQIDEDYFAENRRIIENTLDKYTEEYYNFIKENYKQILI